MCPGSRTGKEQRCRRLHVKPVLLLTTLGRPPTINRARRPLARAGHLARHKRCVRALKFLRAVSTPNCFLADPHPVMAAPSTPQRSATNENPVDPNFTRIKPGRTADTNVHTKYYHAESGRVISHTSMSNYVAWGVKHAGMESKEWEPWWTSIASTQAVKDAIANLVNIGERPHLERASYDPTARALNMISLEIANRYPRRRGPSNKHHAVVFVATGDNLLTGAYDGEAIKADYCAFVVTVDELRAYVAAPEGKAPSITTAPLSALVAVGEHKRENFPNDSQLPQLKTYLEAVKRYRPDLSHVHGFQVAKDHLLTATLSPLYVWSSEATLTSDAEKWICHVYMVYGACDKVVADETAVARLAYHPHQSQFPRWDVRIPERPRDFAIVPFHTGHAPGRVTFAGLELGDVSTADEDAMNDAFYDGQPQGFFKMSWQDTSARATEGLILDKIHEKEWVPGVVRHRNWFREDSNDGIKPPPGLDGHVKVPQRVREFIHLSTVGEPLSQAQTVRQLIYAIIDLIESM